MVLTRPVMATYADLLNKNPGKWIQRQWESMMCDSQQLFSVLISKPCTNLIQHTTTIFELLRAVATHDNKQILLLAMSFFRVTATGPPHCPGSRSSRTTLNVERPFTNQGFLHEDKQPRICHRLYVGLGPRGILWYAHNVEP